jgi:FKBP-type peptidyl-prolyl cis-trans isomerase 2
MPTVEEGCTVIFHYTGILDDGRIFGCSREGSPMKVEIGAGGIIPGFEGGLVGMQVGESRTFNVSPEDAYGEFDEKLCLRMDNNLLGGFDSIKVGMRFKVPQAGGRSLTGTVIQVGEADVLIDLNHPLAGRELSFWVDCLDIRDE